MADDTGTTKEIPNTKEISDTRQIAEIMRKLPPEEAKFVLVYASALHDRSMIEPDRLTSNHKEPAAG